MSGKTTEASYVTIVREARLKRPYCVVVVEGGTTRPTEFSGFSIYANAVDRALQRAGERGLAFIPPKWGR